MSRQPAQEKPAPPKLTHKGHWCQFCRRWVAADEHGVLIHDDVWHAPVALPPAESLH